MIRARTLRLRAALLGFVLSVIGSTSIGAVVAFEQTVAEVVALTGDLAPDGNGNLRSFFSPILNDKGQTAFFADLSNTTGGGGFGVFRGNASELMQIVRERDAAPDGDGTIGFMEIPKLNNDGQVAFFTFLEGTGNNTGIMRGDGTSLVQVARKGNSAPNGNGTLTGLGFPSLNDAGQTAFTATLSEGGSGLYRDDGTMLTPIVLTGDSVPFINGSIRAIFSPVLNESGEVAFNALFSGSDGDAGIFYGDGTSLTPLALTGDEAPDGNGNLAHFDSFAFNNHGQAAFAATLDDTGSGVSDSSGIFIADGDTIAQVARAGGAAPDGNGTFSRFEGVVVNNVGQTAFFALLTGTAGGGSDNSGLYLGNETDLAPIVREGSLVPGGNGRFGGFGFPAINDAGQTAFAASIAGTSGGNDDNQGIYFSGDSVGLLEVARKGAPFLGSHIAELGFTDSAVSQSSGQSGLNQRGQVAYYFALADGRQGIAIWTVPEPASFVLLAVGALGVMGGRCRHTGRGELK